ncbi:DUF2894 domain-containing protein [Alloalcanivorax gelatiniphagus]|uniref:DUF2894 domain-containing protein n=1 Tax=Alloalcanivorax gelatiniphagus TaxID=1194167 RepID=A0ABY2XIQ5_9GAMM|nr:DUF2894 domain-containing protein [Alloalcanivorax gelatiniphagus]TMW11076.1 DUF2894 domain-containing protein [Alloalcanivorax gelatiniphagus]
MNDPASRLQDLREQHGHRYDPMRFEYLESLARRGATTRLTQRLDDFERDLRQAREHAASLLDAAADEAQRQQLREHYQAGDYKAVRRLATLAAPGPSPLAELTRRLREAADAPAGSQPQDALESLLQQHHQRLRADRRGDQDAPRRELKTLATLHARRARQHTARRIRHAVDHPTGDAGPLNAHRQVVRALDQLQELAPEYLERLVGYVDTLMALERAVGKRRG